MILPAPIETLNRELHWFLRQSKAARLRSLREFAEQEIVLPDGPYAGRKFRCERQPYAGFLFDAIDSGQWQRIAMVGPTQSGKTLTGSIIPTLYHLFEVRENVIYGAPDMDMAADKWREDLLPVIERSKYRDLLPRMGGGSKGGKVRAVQFRNGATLRFMSGGGGDKSRAGFTSRVLVVTEVDGMDEAGGGSREADKITQMEGRLRAFGSRKREYLECTASIENGRIWQEYVKGTASRIACKCPHCKAYVSPEREELQGWKDAETDIDARSQSAFFCPLCGEAWSEDNRRAANESALVVHRGQEIGPEGIVGPVPATETLGFRWSAVNNMFRTAGDTGVDEWKGSRAHDEDNAEKELCQFVWAVPYKPPSWDSSRLEPGAVAQRMGKWPQGQLPDDTEYLTMGVDIGKRLLHWSLHAWRENATGHTANDGIIESDSDQLGFDRALVIALAELKDLVDGGWASEAGEKLIPDQVWIDSNWEASTEIVYQFCRESGQKYRPTRGFGTGQERKTYQQPKDTNKTRPHVGDGYHVLKIHDKGVYLLEVDSDQWKSWMHARLATPITEPGAMSLFHAGRTEHTKYVKHLTAEHPEDEFVPGKGMVRKWVRDRKANHWLDTGYLACAAAHLCGARLLPKAPVAVQAVQQQSNRLTMPDGRPYLVTER